MNPSFLFNRLDIYSVIENQKKSLRDAIASAPESLNDTPDDEVIERYLEKFDVQVPILDETQMEVLDKEVELDVSRDPRRMFINRSTPFLIKGTLLNVHVPFTGEAIFFDVQPSSFSISPPRGTIRQNELVLTYQFANDSPPPDIRPQIDRDIQEIKRYLDRLRESVEQMRREMQPLARQAWQQRRMQFASRRQVIAGLGLPRRAEASQDAREAIKPSTEASHSKPRKLPSPKGPANSKASWHVFISHASEDKDAIAKPLAEALRAKGFEVWYDEYTLTVGDSLRTKIDEGLSRSQFGIVVLSRAFFAKHWPQQELNGLAAREVDGVKVILPVWHGVERKDVLIASPILADRVAVLSSRGLDAVVAELMAAMAR